MDKPEEQQAEYHQEQTRFETSTNHPVCLCQWQFLASEGYVWVSKWDTLAELLGVCLNTGVRCLGPTDGLGLQRALQ